MIIVIVCSCHLRDDDGFWALKGLFKVQGLGLGQVLSEFKLRVFLKV